MQWLVTWRLRYIAWDPYRAGFVLGNLEFREARNISLDFLQFLEWKGHRKSNLCLGEGKDQLILRHQCWWFYEGRGHDIGSNGIDRVVSKKVAMPWNLEFTNGHVI